MFEISEEYLDDYKGACVVIKCGGETLEDAAALDNVTDQILFLAKHGIKLALVHGGGGQIKERAEQRGIQETKQDGVRVTCDATLSVAAEVLEELNGKLVSIFKDKIKADASLHGLEVNGFGASEFITAEQVPALGLVGEPSAVKSDFIMRKLMSGIAVIHPICADDKGQLLNVNADSVGGAIGRAINAKRVVFCTSMPGVLDKQKQLISSLDPQAIYDLIADGTITDGMVKKIKECEALLGSVEGVAIVGSAQEDSILHELLGEGAGTLICAA